MYLNNAHTCIFIDIHSPIQTLLFSENNSEYNLDYKAKDLLFYEHYVQKYNLIGRRKYKHNACD